MQPVAMQKTTADKAIPLFVSRNIIGRKNGLIHQLVVLKCRDGNKGCENDNGNGDAQNAAIILVLICRLQKLWHLQIG